MTRLILMGVIIHPDRGVVAKAAGDGESMFASVRRPCRKQVAPFTLAKL